MIVRVVAQIEAVEIVLTPECDNSMREAPVMPTRDRNMSRLWNLIAIGRYDPVVGPRVTKPTHDRFALIDLPNPMVRRLKRNIFDDDVDNLVRELSVALPILGEIQRLWFPGVRMGRLDDHKVIDQRIEYGQPDLQDVELVEEREAIENARRVHLAALATNC